jgi:glyoxalase family protein
MLLEGIHHITAITGDAQRNLDFYVGLLGLRFVKKTVNFDAPDVYHLYYGDDVGTPGSVLTFFEFPGALPGRAGDGMIHTIAWRVAGDDALGFWEERLSAAGIAVTRSDGRLDLTDPEGLALALVVAGTEDAPLAATAPDVPPEHALQGFDGVRAYASNPAASEPLLDALGFEPHGADSVLAGETRRARLGYDAPPARRGTQGAGTVHHIAWATRDEDQEQWRETAAGAGARPTPVIDRQYFRSVYFREPSGVLFEVATLGPGFAIDEPVETLGSALTLPPQHERLRAQLERRLTPLRHPWARA